MHTVWSKPGGANIYCKSCPGLDHYCWSWQLATGRFLSQMIKKVSFALLWPAGYVNFTCRGGARPTFCWAWQPAFPLGRASIPDMDPVVNDEVGTERVKSWTFLIRRQICHQIWWTFLWHTLWSLILVTTLAPYLVNPLFGAWFVTKFVTKHGDHQIWHQIGWQIHHKIWWSPNISQNQSQILVKIWSTIC